MTAAMYGNRQLASSSLKDMATCIASHRVEVARYRSSTIYKIRKIQNIQLAAHRPTHSNEVPRLNPELDDTLSSRSLTLDPSGYFLIKLDRTEKEIVAEFYTNIINKNGLACDPQTGEVIPCTPGYVRPPSRVYRGHTAKQIAVRVLEDEDAGNSFMPCTRLEHACYLGREFQRAELALISGQEYIQD